MTSVNDLSLKNESPLSLSLVLWLLRWLVFNGDDDVPIISLVELYTVLKKVVDHELVELLVCYHIKVLVNYCNKVNIDASLEDKILKWPNDFHHDF